MAELSALTVRDHFAEIVNRVAYGKERIVLTRRGKAVVGIVPLEDLRLLEGLKTHQEQERGHHGESDT
jgi:prevent-host-death family protein